MKKFISTFLIFLLLSFFMLTKSAYAANTFTEGVYKASDFNLSSDNKYVVQNVSQNHNIYLQVFDENQIIIQSIRLSPNSDKFNLIALMPSYRIVIVGNGTMYIS